MIVNRFELTQKLKQLKGLTPPKTTMAITGVLVSFGKIIATNIETTVSAEINLIPEQPFVLPTNAIEMIEKLSCDEVDITVKSDKVKIKHANGTSSFSTVDFSTFPNLIENISLGNCKSVVACTGGEFTEYISRVTHISENNSSNVIASSVCITGFKSGAVEFATCDGRSCAYIQGLKALNEFKTIIQTATVKKVVSLINGNSNDEFGFFLPDEKHAVFKSGDYTVYTSLISANFIDYKSAFPKEPKATFEVNKNAIIKTLERAIICSDALNPAVITAENTKLNVSVRSATSAFNETTELSHDIGNADVKLGINAKILSALLKASDEEKIRFSFSSAVQPLVVDDGFLHQIIMPVRLTEGT